MSTFTQILYQIVFSTKNRERTLTSDGRSTLFGYITGIHKAKGCHLYRLNGIEDHIHIATHVHPSVALATLVKDIKLATSDFIKKESLFRNFGGWQDGYAAFTYSYKDKDALIEYIKKISNSIIKNFLSRKNSLTCQINTELSLMRSIFCDNCLIRLWCNHIRFGATLKVY